MLLTLRGQEPLTLIAETKPLNWVFSSISWCQIQLHSDKMSKCSAFPLVCEDALGIERGFFNVSASTYLGPGYEPSRGRLNHDAGIWRPLLNKNHEFLQFNFDHVMAITGLAIQGDYASCGRVTRFYLHYGLDGKRFETYVDPVHKEVSTKLRM